MKRRMTKLAFGLCLLASTFTLACGSDDEEPTGSGGATGGGGAIGSGGSAGTSGSGGGAGASGGGGMAGSAGGGTGGATGSAYAAKIVAGSEKLFVGKGQLSLEITTVADGKPAAGLASSLALSPVMQMGQMAHGAPVPADAVKESSTPGTYDATLFFSMASGSMGSWTLNVAKDKDSIGALPIKVDEPSGTDTTHVPLKNAADTIKTPMGADKPRNWFVFRDTLSATSGGHELEVFLATVQAGNMVWPPVTVGLELVDEAGKAQLTVSTLAVEVSTDGSTWAPMTCGATARCKATLAGLTKGAKSDVFVKLAVNGKDYTTDGAAAEPSKKNGYATFSLTAP
jgi:hypothetical protein